MKKRILLITLVLTLLSSTVFAVNKTNIQKASITVHVYIDGNEVTFPDAQPFIVKKDSRTLVPIRFIAEDLGYKVDWDEENWNKGGKEDKKVTITNADKVMELFIGQNYAYINGEKKVYDTKPILDGTRTFVPLRFVAENFDCTVDYRHDTKAKLMKVYIMTKDSDFEIPEEPENPTTPSKIKGNADEMTEDERYAAVRDFFGEYQYQNGLPTFKAIAGSADGAFLWIYEDPGEATIVIQSWYVPSDRKEYESMGSLELYQMIPPTAKEVLRFYLPNGGADELYKIIDDGYNGRLGKENAKSYTDKDISKMIGSDRPVKITQGGGLRIHIGTKGK